MEEEIITGRRNITWPKVKRAENDRIRRESGNGAGDIGKHWVLKAWYVRIYPENNGKLFKNFK